MNFSTLLLETLKNFCNSVYWMRRDEDSHCFNFVISYERLDTLRITRSSDQRIFKGPGGTSSYVPQPPQKGLVHTDNTCISFYPEFGDRIRCIFPYKYPVKNILFWLCHRVSRLLVLQTTLAEPNMEGLFC